MAELEVDARGEARSNESGAAVRPPPPPPSVQQELARLREANDKARSQLDRLGRLLDTSREENLRLLRKLGGASVVDPSPEPAMAQPIEQAVELVVDDGEIEGLRAELEAAKGELGAIRAQLESMRAARDEASRERDEARAELARFKGEWKGARRQLERALGEATAIAAEREEERTRSSELAREVEHLRGVVRASSPPPPPTRSVPAPALSGRPGSLPPPPMVPSVGSYSMSGDELGVERVEVVGARAAEPGAPAPRRRA